MAPESEGNEGSAGGQSIIRKLTTEKAVKTQKAAAAPDITNIKLSGRGIKTIESLELPSLRRLDLSKNNLNRLKGLQGCPQVTYLTAAGNELTGEGLDGVRPLRDLKVFNASGNRVKRIPPSVFSQFQQLQALVLNNNEISEVPPTWLKKGLLTLNTFVLSHNKVKSLSGSGLDRLTGLTKLSVSHNLLSELPDLSACSGLEELRAAHNFIKQVPASLGKNVALRTLDLGHNSIGEWVGLERVGKRLTSLVQLTLAGNPLCGTGVQASAEEEAGAGDMDEGEEGEGQYINKVRSLFPGLKVRDGKRILMKKSHTYYEHRAAEAEARIFMKKSHTYYEHRAAEAEAGAKDEATTRRHPASATKPAGLARPPPGSGRVPKGATLRPGSEGEPRKKVGHKKSRPAAETELGEKGEGGLESMDSGDGAEVEERSKAGRKLEKKAARAARAAGKAAEVLEGGAGAREGGGVLRDPAVVATDALGSERKKRKKKRRREDVKEEENSPSPQESQTNSPVPSRDGKTTQQQQQQQQRESKKRAAVRETAVATADAAEREETAHHGKKRAIKPKKSTKSEAATGKRSRENEADGGRGGGVGGRGGGGKGKLDQDPYSSSEELPIPAKISADGSDTAREMVGAQSTISAVDPSSGVVGVVLNKKRKGAERSKAKPWVGSAMPLVGDGGAGGGGGEERGFSVGAMLEARGQRETVGSGSGISAWD